MEQLRIQTIKTVPFDGQQPGTSGLRKKVKVFMQKNYTENFVQSIIDVLTSKISGSTLVLGGDGRYFCKQAVYKIIQMAAANRVQRMIVGRGGLLSTPAVSCLIRKYETLGGIILTASHNPGGIQHDFGIKFNVENGGPAPDAFSNTVYERTKTISDYRIVSELDVNLNELGRQTFQVEGLPFFVDIVDPVEDYLQLLKSIFDFKKLQKLIRCDEQPFNVRIDAMNGVAGLYAQRIFLDELKCLDGSVVRSIPLDNFGEIHPDPNLTYAIDLVNALKTDSEIDLGAAFDGDGDRNMILGKNAFFVTPSDSLAVIAHNLLSIPYYQKQGIHGFARSMPTSGAVDLVAQKLNKELFIVPVGWKFFSNLMDVGRLSVCGEESFGTGSSHIREKDGIWAVLAWLSIIEHKRMSVEDIMHEHWREFGRNFYTRYDYEECDSAACAALMSHISSLISDRQQPFVGRRFETKSHSADQSGKVYVVKYADEFSYTDPIDNNQASKQGTRIVFEDGSRIIYRLSGTGSTGSTLRIYIDSYEKKNYMETVEVMLKPLVDIAFQICQLKHFIGFEEPTVIT